MADAMYHHLDRILSDAADQSKHGKGKERHADAQPFESQPICVIARWVNGSPAAGPLQQVVKKARESARMPPDRAIRELYGVIVYAAAAIKILEEEVGG